LNIPVKEAPRKSPVAITAGMSLALTQWNQAFGFNQQLSYHFASDAYTRLEGNLALSDLGISMGASAEVDNNAIGAANKYMGYIGLKQFYLRAGGGQLRGTTTWSGVKDSRLPVSSSFNTRYSNVDLLIWFKHFLGVPGLPAFVGVGYTSFNLPVEIKAWESPDKGHTWRQLTSVYDPDYKVHLYNVLFGFDTFTSSMLYPDTDMMAANNPSKEGWGMFFATEDRFGIGPATISPNAFQAAQALNKNLNPLYSATSDSSNYWLIQNDTSLGVKWTKNLGSARLALGLGYGVSLLIGEAFQGVPSSPTQVTLQPEECFLNHGPIARMYMRW